MKNALIDLRSDTVTQPSLKMRAAIQNCSVGDDSYLEDVSVNKLTDYCKELFQVEDAVFTTSGMLSNRLAILSQTHRGDEVITDYNYHINFFDSAAVASVCHVVLNAQQSTDGILTPAMIELAIHSKPRYYLFAQPKMVTIENTINGWVGKIYPFADLKKLYHWTSAHGLKLHLDGARLFNAHVKTKIPLAEYAQYTDTLSVCFAKGLGAPFGSILMGKKETMAQAKKYKVWLGSGFHQVGFNAAAALYALENNIPYLNFDHEKTLELRELLKSLEEITLHPNSGETNMIQFQLNEGIKYEHFNQICQKKGLLLFPWLKNKFRAVIHRDITHDDILKSYEIVKQALYEARNAS
ncbi:MAG: threonine aldolase [Rickettsiales bacterium]|nr:threonine aldolase [Rickettsiales bacterium]|tara:strand:- start:14888 stop:15946 length:1059 start_codon:yes stop_codon:yes gene_type:complete